MRLAAGDGPGCRRARSRSTCGRRTGRSTDDAAGAADTRIDDDARGVAVLVRDDAARPRSSIDENAAVERPTSSSTIAATRVAHRAVDPRRDGGRRDGGGAGRPDDPCGSTSRRSSSSPTTVDADGIDLDYEQFAFADGRETWAATRPNWVAFVTELADALHADGRTLTVSIPPVYDADETGDSGYWVYDHGAIAEVRRRIRIMAYDYSIAEPGPIAPLAWVEQAVEGAKKAVADDSKLVLGVPMYGYNWVIATVGTCPPTAEGRTGVTTRSVDDLIARRRRDAGPRRGVGEWSFTYDLEVTDGTTTCTQTREVHYVDADGARGTDRSRARGGSRRRGAVGARLRNRRHVGHDRRHDPGRDDGRPDGHPDRGLVVAHLERLWTAITIRRGAGVSRVARRSGRRSERTVDGELEVGRRCTHQTGLDKSAFVPVGTVARWHDRAAHVGREPRLDRVCHVAPLRLAGGRLAICDQRAQADADREHDDARDRERDTKLDERVASVADTSC